jgi:hypothetical protein
MGVNTFREETETASGRRCSCSESKILSKIEIEWGRMASCAAVAYRRRMGRKTLQADWQSAAAYQAAPQLAALRTGLRGSPPALRGAFDAPRTCIQPGPRIQAGTPVENIAAKFNAGRACQGAQFG